MTDDDAIRRARILAETMLAAGVGTNILPLIAGSILCAAEDAAKAERDRCIGIGGAVVAGEWGDPVMAAVLAARIRHGT